jgi:hypothetical protein
VAAFRTILIHPKQQVWTCLSWDGLIYVDPDCSFGGRSSSGNFGIVADALAALYIANGMNDLLKWADDFNFWRYPVDPSRSNCVSYSYDESLIWKLAEELGLPWSPKKHQPFSAVFSYLGFEWDLEKKTVTIGKAKCTKYLLRLQPWVPGSRFTKTEVQQLIRTLNHCSVVLIGGQSHLPTLYQFISTFSSAKNAFVTHSVTHGVIADVSWWRSELTKPWCGAHICRVPPAL